MPEIDLHLRFNLPEDALLLAALVSTLAAVAPAAAALKPAEPELEPAAAEPEPAAAEPAAAEPEAAKPRRGRPPKAPASTAKPEPELAVVAGNGAEDLTSPDDEEDDDDAFGPAETSMSPAEARDAASDIIGMLFSAGHHDAIRQVRAKFGVKKFREITDERAFEFHRFASELRTKMAGSEPA